MRTFVLTVLLATLFAVESGQAAIESYVSSLLTNRPSIRASKFKYTQTASDLSGSTLFIELDASPPNFLIKHSRTNRSLTVGDRLTEDMRLVAKADGGYWFYDWEQGGFHSTDLESLGMARNAGQFGCFVMFRADSFLAELPFLGIPDYWDPDLHVDPAQLVWSYEATNAASTRHSFRCQLRMEAGGVVADIEYPSRTNAFRFLRKIVTFDAGGNEPRELVCHAGPSKDELTPLYTLEALGPVRFRAPEGRVFNMTNYFISGARELREVRGGTHTFKEIPEPPPSSNNFLGLRLRAGSVRAVLWGALGLLSLGIAVLLFARKKPSR